MITNMKTMFQGCFRAVSTGVCSCHQKSDSLSIYVYSDTARGFVVVQAAEAPRSISIRAADGREVAAPEIRRHADEHGRVSVTLDASGLQTWSPEHPALYEARVDGASLRFGHIDFKDAGHLVLVNDAPYYFRGYIRGIAAHEHPNMTGGDKREFYRKNILQAKKYGFNLVRFHSTIPDEEFVAAADELGLFIHMELGFSYEYDANGKKTRIFLDAERWEATIRKYRNSPSIAIFCLGNEMHNSGRRPESHALYAEARRLAPGKLIMDNSGWGEYDRTSADIYSQHIAYFFPYKRHAEMFRQDFCWRNNGSMYEVPLEAKHAGAGVGVEVSRALNPIRPVIAHEAIHYIDFPDYPALEKKFDEFSARVGPAYLEAHKITKPRYLVEIPALAAAKGLEHKLPDYVAASREFKRFAVKAYLERLRLAGNLCGYEMLQFADCLKYENHNGVVDCFDDDKYLDAAWFRRFNADTVLVADIPEESARAGGSLGVGIHLSHFGVERLLTGSLTLVLDDGRRREEVFSGRQFSAGHGVSKLVQATIRFKAATRARRYRLEATFTTPGGTFCNDWTLWAYPAPKLAARPALKVADAGLKTLLSEAGRGARADAGVLFTDTLDASLWAPLKAGKTVVLSYHRDNPKNAYYWPGAFDRFKPCIWDRGNNLGGIVDPAWLQAALGGGRYFAENLQPLVEEGYKINLDGFPTKVAELVNGVDKPCRDRMNGLVLGIKDFQPDEVLRNFCYLFSLRVGPGTLIVSTFNLRQSGHPVVGAYVAALLNRARRLKPRQAVEAAALKRYLEEATRRGPLKETVMNHFWELDAKPVEDTLFWEAAGIDLTKSKLD